MDLEAAYTYLAQQNGAEETFPFGPQVLVFKVGGKMFALVGVDNIPPTVSLKCDPEQALHWRERYEAVQPGYHLSKKHWNTITLDGSVPPADLRAMMDRSYALIVQSLKKADREALGL